MVILAGFGLYYFGGYDYISSNYEAAPAGNVTSPLMLIPGGTPVGIYMDTDGVMVINTQIIEGPSGKKINPGEGIIESGDYIIEMNGEEIETKNQLLEQVEGINGDIVDLKIRREEEILLVKIQPTIDVNGTYKLGLWVRDNLQGLGTLTYVDPSNNFGALGHGIHDIDTSELLEITNGELYKASISGIIKGESGSPGGLEGIIIYNKFNNIGEIKTNHDSGIYGTLNNTDNLGIDTTAIPIGTINEIEKGYAQIRSTIDDKVNEYDIEILKVNKYGSEVNKGIVIRITDAELIRETGGIVQGMSGSPIIQNGKIIGAVTHVMVNDPTKGYGIFIENMLAVQ